MKKRTKLFLVPTIICLFALLMSSCGRYEVTNIRQFCPSPYYGLGAETDISLYDDVRNQKATAVADGTLYMAIDNGSYVERESYELPHCFYLMRCGDDEWEKLAEAPIAEKFKNTYIPLVVNEEERIFAVTNVEEGICVYEYAEGELVPNTFKTDAVAERMSHIVIGAEIREEEGKSGTIYMCYKTFRDCVEVNLLTYDIAEKKFSDSTIVATTEIPYNFIASQYEAVGGIQPYIFFPEENTVEVICLGDDMMDYYLIDTSGSSPMLLESKSLAENLAKEYSWCSNTSNDGDVVRLDNGDIHIITTAVNKNDEFSRISFAHLVVRDGEVIHEKIFMPSSSNFVQVFVGVDGKAYLLMIQNEQEILPEDEFNEFFNGESNGYINGVFYVLNEDGVEELGSVYVDGVPYVLGTFQLTADKEERIVYICYKGHFTANIVTCEISY